MIRHLVPVSVVALAGVLLLLGPASAQWSQEPGIAILGDSLTSPRTQDRPTSYNSFGNVSGSSHQLGGSEYYGFTDGNSTTRSRLGGTDFYGGTTPSLSGSTSRLGGTTYGAWMDGTSSTHMTLGGTTYHGFSDGRTCSSMRLGGSTYTGC